MTEPPLTDCPECGKKKLRRLIGAGAALLFRGSGFYITDYRSEAYKSAAKADREAGGAKVGGNGTADGGGKKGAGESAKSAT